jgi:SynChlorMet cassette protein ScmC
VLLAGPGGYGKSTCCKRVPSPWRCLCDDESLIIKARDGYVVHPLPTWSEHFKGPSDKSWDVSHSVPLGGIFFLEQDQVDEIVPMTPVHIAARINFSAVEAFNKYIMHRTVGRELKRDIRIRILNNASDISRQVHCASLKFSKDGAFWREIEKSVSC